MLLLSAFLSQTNKLEAQIVIAPQPYISSSGVAVGVIKATSGTALLPSYTFAADLSTGAWLNGAGLYVISASGSARLGVNTNGPVLDAVGSLQWATGGIGNPPDIYLRRSGTKTITLDTDGAGGNLTAINFDATTNTFLGDILIPTNRSYLFSGQGGLSTTADGKFNFSNNAVGAGIGFDVTTDGTLKCRNRAQSGDCTFTAGLIQISDVLAFGGVTASQPMLHANGTTLETKLANNSAYTTHAALNFNIASTGSFTGLGGAAITATAPTIASGGCTSPAVTDNNGTASFKITIGTSCTGVKTFTLTLPAAAHRWSCSAHDLTTPDSFKPDQTAAASTTAVVITNYSRTTGAQIDFVASEVLQLECLGG